jgi:hypothetical protein
MTAASELADPRRQARWWGTLPLQCEVALFVSNGTPRGTGCTDMRSGELHDATRMRGRKQTQRSRPQRCSPLLLMLVEVEPRLAPRPRPRRQRTALVENSNIIRIADMMSEYRT